MNFSRKARAPSSILGLALNGTRLEGVLLRRSNGSLHIQKTFAATLALNPLTADPELVGREIRNHLEQAGLRQRRCAVCVPLSWALTLQTKVPDLPEADLCSFLAIEAERGFPYGPEALSIATSRYRAPGGEQYATLVAIPKNYLRLLERALRAAQLRPISFTIGIAALQSAGQESSRGVLALAIGEQSVDLQLTCDGGVAALRALEGAIEAESPQPQIYPEMIAREIRVTLGQLPDEVRGTLRKIRLFGAGESVARFAEEIAPRAQALGLPLERVAAYSPDDFRSHFPPNTPVSPALSLAARHLTGVGSEFEFLPPKVRAWQQLSARFSSKKLVWVGATAGAAALLAASAILAQHWQVSQLRTRWANMEPKVRQLEEMQQQIRRFRPWFDDSLRSLNILRRITEAFPADGVVTAKTVEIREPASVTCSGSARDNQAFLKLLDQLRAAKEISDVKVERMQGKGPLLFSFNFQWQEAGHDH